MTIAHTSRAVALVQSPMSFVPGGRGRRLVDRHEATAFIRQTETGERVTRRQPIAGERGWVLWPPGLGDRLAAEALGTALLVVFGAGAVVAALRTGGGELDYGGLGFVALSFGLVIAIVVYGFGEVSGAHINPVVTLALAVTGRFPWREVVPYGVAQLAGGTAGGLVVLLVFGGEAVEHGVGGTTLSEGVGTLQGGAAEATGTFLLVLAIMAMAIDERTPTAWAGWIIGLSVTCSILVVGPLTGSSLNPARTLGPAVSTAVGGGSVPWSQLLVYTLGPALGAIAAALAYDLIARPRDAVAATDATA